jgi:amidase
VLSPAEYAAHDALGLAELVRSGTVTARDVVESAIRVIELVDPRLNAVVTRMDELALAAAARPGSATAPFGGVPCVLKDEMQHIAGTPTRNASRLFAGVPTPAHETELMARYRRAGLIVVGKANLPEFGASVTCEPIAGGTTCNPWDLERTVGGSSGGSAAAVAAGLVPLAYGNDGAGSLRIPSSCTGTFGFKPSRGRVPTGPVEGEFWNGLVIEHAITRSVRDSAALLDATDGADVGAPYSAPPKQRPYLQELGWEPGRLRVGFSTASPHGTPVDACCVDACLDAARLLESLGHHVEPAAPVFDGPALVSAVSDLLSIHLAHTIDQITALRGAPATEADVEPGNLALAARGRARSAGDLLEILQTLNAVARTAARFWTEYDLLLTPTLGQEPVRHGVVTPTEPDPDRYLRAWFTFAPFTPIANVTGQPSMNLPLFWNAAGLPIGVTLTGGPGAEDVLFRVAAQLESARPWAGRRPGTSVWSLA